MTDFFDDLERELRRAHRRDIERHASSRVFDRRRLPGLRVAGRRTLVALAVVVALVAAVLAVGRGSDVERPAATPGKQVVTLVSTGMRFSLDGRVLTVQLLPDAPSQTIRRVSGVRISATCGAKGSAPPGDGRRETVTRLWPAGQRSLSYRFGRNVSDWCRLDDDPVDRPSVAFVVFPGGSPPAMELIRDVANNWLSFARIGLNISGNCPRHWNQGECEGLWHDATVQDIAVNGDRATVRFSNGKTIELHRNAHGEWQTHTHWG